MALALQPIIVAPRDSRGDWLVGRADRKGVYMTKRKVTRICPACHKPYKCSVAHLKTHLWNGALVFDNGFWFTRDHRFIKTSNTRQDEAALTAALDVVAMYQNCDDPLAGVADYFGFTKERFAQLVSKRRRAA